MSLWLGAMLVLSAGPVPDPLTLDAALGLARQHQPSLRRARAQTIAAQARARSSFAPLLPQLNATAQYQRATGNVVTRAGTPTPPQVLDPDMDSFNFWTFGLSGSQTVYDFGQSIGRWQAAEESALAQADEEARALGQADLDLRLAYFQARAARALVKVAQESVQNQERHLKQIEGFVEVGTRPRIDLVQAKTEHANARVQLINAENGYAVARAELNVAMGVEASAEYDIAEESVPPVAGEDAPVDELMSEAVRARPELQALQHRLSAQEMTQSAARGGYGPSLSVAASLTDAGAQLDALTWNWSAGVLLNWPLFSGGATDAQVDLAGAELLDLRAQHDAVRLNVRLDVEQARLAVRASKAAVEAAGDAVANGKERLRLAEGRYDTGIGSIIELGDAQLALTSAESQKVQADYDLASARARLLRALGR